MLEENFDFINIQNEFIFYYLQQHLCTFRQYCYLSTAKLGEYHYLLLCISEDAFNSNN